MSNNKSLRWYLDRVKAMEAAETRHRVDEWITRRRWTRSGAPSAVVRSVLAAPAGKGAEGWAAGYNPAAAEQILSGHITQLGVPVDLDGNWLRDPLTGVTAPLDPAFRMPLGNRELVGDIRQLWELSRLQHLPVLAAAFAATHDERYAQRVDEHLRSWVDQNPFLQGPNWTSGIELGLRVTSFVWTRRLLDGWDGAPKLFEQNPAFVTSLGQHQQWLAKFTSIGSSANNHAVAEASGQFCAATAFPWLEQSKRWRREAAEFLQETVSALTFPSGLNNELASHYHLFTLELVLSALIEDEYSGDPILHRSLGDAVVRMSDAMAAVIDSSGRLPRQGDSDDASVIGFDSIATDPLHTLAFAAGVIEALPWWPHLPPDPRGAYIRDQFRVDSINPRPLDHPAIFADAGCAVLQGNSSSGAATWFRFDFGPHGGTSIGAHSHADALSIELRVNGVDVIADAGTFRYSDTKRAYYRGTGAHSTIEIDGKDQSISGGPFLWSKAATTTTNNNTSEKTGTTVIAAQHDGYDPIIHRRTITTDAPHSSFEIADEVTGEQGHSVVSRLLLGPTITAELVHGAATLRTNGNDGQIIATVTLPSELTWSIEHGQTDGTGPWYSPAFGEQVPTSALIGRGITPLALVRTTIAIA